MARNQQKQQQDTSDIEFEQRIEEFDFEENDELEATSTTTSKSKRLGGPTGGDFDGSGKGPALGETHAADDSTADHYGSREETQAALEGKIASQNTLKLHGHL